MPALKMGGSMANMVFLKDEKVPLDQVDEYHTCKMWFADMILSMSIAAMTNALVTEKSFK